MRHVKTFRWLVYSVFVIGFLAAIPLTEQEVSANTYYFELFGGVPLVQDWTDTSQIITNDDWTNTISFQGFRGDGLTSIAGVDPQTVVADGQTTTPLDVNANQSNPDTFVTGGVTEFEIANPSIALKGSATADAPHLMIYLDTTPCPLTKSMSIRYNVRDLDGTANNAVQQLALQYRIGMTDPFTNLPDGFVADATDPNTATKVTPVFVNLPHGLINNPKVEIRLITTNADSGINEWIGIDDIEVGCYFPTAANVTLAGKVMSAESRGISRARVTILNTSSLETRYVSTNQFGYFAADGLNAGDFYIVSVEHKRFRFSNHTRSFQMLDDLKGLTFYADAPGFKPRSSSLKKQ